MLLHHRLLKLAAVAVALAPAIVLAHPGEVSSPEEAVLSARIRHAIADADHSELSKCGDTADTKSRAERAMARRMKTFQRLRKERGITDGESSSEQVVSTPSIRSWLTQRSESHPYIHRRDNAAFAKWSAASHDKTGTFKFTTDTPHAQIFGANSTCILTPDNIIGPYFVHGEQIRSNIVEGHRGVPVHLEISFVNTQTCKATPNLLIDIWQCNATGVYSGVNAAGQAGLKTTFLRGV